ncbi:unnamed protein product (macronuclear) [Paramecium tetraurelia]|uniref:Uncharacterized protein n=1 Tax=Paramecium tetraurelia TaxID=5888 RepID=A0EEA8_PARTE|nr:uncharacterized protein GSPATT00025970001 [Paramecium tetraurelia]CAK93625.1 unnamed protein product [Paramecium tetraurelia]|eukprot:XP_001461022.1 hypothetical protein (macronuclear) [Paramecium tetraurelia strain d4-2]
MNKQKQLTISSDWINEIKQASDPLSHSQMYIKHLSDVLLSHNKTLKIRLEIYEKEPITYSQITKAIASNKANDKLNDQNTQQKSNQHKSNQGISNLEESLGPAIEQIKELQKVIEELKKQNIELHEQMKQKLSTMKQAKIIIPHKFEGHDYVGDQLLIGKSTLVNVKKISYEPFHKSSLNQQNSSKDKQIQNLINQKKYLEQEILHFKETGIIRKPKLEGQDLESIIKRYEKNKSMVAAQERFNKQIRQQEDLKDQYLQALIEETFLLQQQLRLMTQSKS